VNDCGRAKPPRPGFQGKIVNPRRRLRPPVEGLLAERVSAILLSPVVSACFQISPSFWRFRLAPIAKVSHCPRL